MAELHSDDENELNFSDYEANNSDSDADNPPPKPTGSVIAHKEMKIFQISDAEDDSDKDDSDREDSDKEDLAQDLEFETISPAASPVHLTQPSDISNDEENSDSEKKMISTVISTHINETADEESINEPEKQTFEPISPVSDHGNNFETISPPGSPTNVSQSTADTKPQFENISDEEDEEIVKKTEDIPEGKFSPVQESDNELNFHVDSSNDSGYQIIEPVKKTPLHDENQGNENEGNGNQGNENEKIENKEIENEEIENEEIENEEIENKEIENEEIENEEIENKEIENEEIENEEIENEEIENEEIENEEIENEEIENEEYENEENVNEVNKEKEEIGELGNEIDRDKEIEKVLEDNEVGDEVDEEDIEAPMPSPFSDIGDLDDMMEGMEDNMDGQIISDILKDTDATEKQFEFDLGLSSGKASDADEELQENNEDPNETDNKSKEVEGLVKGETDEKEKDDEETTGTINNKEAADSDQESGEVGEQGKADNLRKKDEEEEGEDAGHLIADIFGDSDDEEEFEGFADEEIPEGDNKDKESDDDEEEEETVNKVTKSVEEERKDESSDDERIVSRDFVNDFDLMMEKRRAQARKARKRKKDVDICGDNDEIISAMIRSMKSAADEDRMLNQAGKAATKKLKMLGNVITHLRKNDLQMTLIDCGILSAMKEWLTPLPDHALPHIHIRQRFLHILQEFPPLDKSALKQSGIGRAVMLLFKHPKEIRENKYVAGKLISNWARPIFNVSTNFLDVSKEEREERDKQTLANKKRSKEEREDMEPKRTKLDKEEEENENRPRKPGDKGWCKRARVPQSSSRDYVHRPVSKLDQYEQSRQLNTKQPLNRYEKHALKMKGKRALKAKAMDISLSGSKLGL